MSLRYDRGTLRKPERLSDGSLRVDAVLTRSGVFEYRNPNGTISREYRAPSEVRSRASLDSFVGVAVTDDHPWSEEHGLITLDNRERLQCGTVLSVRADGNEVIGTLIITNRELIAKLEAGETAVSCGYEQDLIAGSGVTPEGERFDAQQTNIRGNHVAVAVSVARAGDTARVRMDAATMIAGEPAPKENVMNLEQALAALAVANVKVGELTARNDSLAKDLDTEKKAHGEAKTRLDSVTAECDAAKEKAEKAEKARTDSEGTMMERARARIALEGTAAKHLRNDAGEPDDVSKKSDHEIRTAVAEKLTGKSMAGKSEAYVNARFDAAIESATDGDEAMNSVREAADDAVRSDAGSDDVAMKARDEMIKRNQNAHNRNEKKGA
jgi:hypothetical protein